MRNFIRYFCLFLIIGFATTKVSAQSARSLFVSGGGVSFDTAAPSAAKSTEKPKVAEKPKSQAKAKSSPESASAKVNKRESSKPSPEKFVGLSYSIFKKFPTGEFKKVPPNIDFRTGDRIRVEVESNTSGTLITGNINPKGVVSLLSMEGVKAKSVTRIPQNGSLKFAGQPGKEKLVFVLSKQNPSMLPKDKASKILKGCKAKPSTRSIIVDDTAGNSFQLADANGNCRPEKRKSSLTRSIIVDVEDDSGFGVVEDEALSGDSFLSLIVNLNHI